MRGALPAQSWIHVLEWRATVRPEVTALVDDRGYERVITALRPEAVSAGLPAAGPG